MCKGWKAADRAPLPGSVKAVSFDMAIVGPGRGRLEEAAERTAALCPDVERVLVRGSFDNLDVRADFAIITSWRLSLRSLEFVDCVGLRSFHCLHFMPRLVDIKIRATHNWPDALKCKAFADGEGLLRILVGEVFAQTEPPMLEHVDLSGCACVTDDVVRMILGNPNVRRLVLPPVDWT